MLIIRIPDCERSFQDQVRRESRVFVWTVVRVAALRRNPISLVNGDQYSLVAGNDKMWLTANQSM